LIVPFIAAEIAVSSNPGRGAHYGGRFVQLSSGDSQASFATLTEFGVRDDLVSLFVAHDMTARAPSAREMFLNMGSTFLRVEASVSVYIPFRVIDGWRSARQDVMSQHSV
jgi:hypothetical protein